MLRGVMTFAEAAKRWGLNPSSLRQGFKRFREDEYTKSGKVHLVTEEGMIRLYGFPKDMRKKVIEELIEKGSLLVDSNWAKENDEDLYYWLLDELESFAADPRNTATQKDVEGFQNGDYLIELYFSENGVGYVAGKTPQDIANQPSWGFDSWEDIPDEKLQIWKEAKK